MSAESLILRGELRGEKKLYILAALTTAFATAALTLVLSIGDTFERSFASSAKTLLGGDISVRLRQRDFTADELKWLRENSLNSSLIRTAGVLAISGDNSQMTRVKAADSAYPLYGELRLQNGDANDLQNLLNASSDESGIYPAAVDGGLLELLNLSIGDTFQAVGLTLRIADIVTQEPDPDERVWMSAPLILTGSRAADDGHLSGSGMLSSRYVRILLPENETTEEWQKRLSTAFPAADWQVRKSQRSLPGLRRFVSRMRNFLSIMSLAAMIIAGIGVGGAASAFLRARTRAIAVIKMLGGDSKLITRVYLKMAALFIVSGAIIGAFIGATLLFWFSPYLSSSLPLKLSPEWPWSALLKAIIVATAMGAAFIILPVLRAGRVNPLTLFKADDNDSTPLTKRDFLIGACLWTAVFVIIPLSYREKIAAIGILGAAAIIYALSVLCARFAGAAVFKTMPPAISWGLLAISRNRHQTASGIVSLSIGMALLIAILNMEGNFSARIDDTLRQQAPTFYLVGIQQGQEEELEKTLVAAVPNATLRSIPFIRGRIKSIGGRDADTIDAPDSLNWILNGSRGLTWTGDDGYIGASQVSEGTLWDKNEQRPQASFDAEAAEAFGMKLGDELVINILGEPLTVIITSLRDINWQSFDINFVIILDRRPFGSIPYSLMGTTFTPPKDESAAKLAVVRKFPNITPISTGAVFDMAQRLLKNISLLLQAAAIFMLIGAAPVVIAALMDGQRRRVRDAITLRLLGAPISSLIGKGLTEFATIAAVALLPALIFGMLASKLTVEHIFELEWQINRGSPLLVAAAGFILFSLIGSFSIAKWVRQPPLAVIRND